MQQRPLSTATGNRHPWQDVAQPVELRVADLMARMTLEEKIAQLYGVWVGAAGTGEDVAPHQHDSSTTPWTGKP